tara:strand:- start:811 stop:969 length:159 start_codon:yes stop_codon:yes gene_type:complete
MITKNAEKFDIINLAVDNNMAYITYNDNIYVETDNIMVQIYNLKQLLTLING